MTYDTLNEYDFVIARGSINYLTAEEISKVISSLKPGGIFLANTFLHPPGPDWRERKVENGNGEQGVEAVRCDGKYVYHNLSFPSTGIIAHKFFYYTLSDYEDMIGEDVGAQDYAPSSYMLSYQKPLKNTLTV